MTTFFILAGLAVGILLALARGCALHHLDRD